MASVDQLHISCLCGAIQLDGSCISDSKQLPIETGVCHCDDCRYQTGALFLGAYLIHEPPSTDLLAKCTEYNASEKLGRYFCSTCGSFAFITTHSSGLWAVGCGLVEQSAASKAANEPFPADVMKLTHHYWVSNTRDYKLAARLMELGGREVKVFAKDDEGTTPLSKEEVLNLSANTDYSATSQSDSLEARCHCGGVDFRISRPDWSGFPAATAPPEEHKHKLRATFCVCRHCRLGAGVSSIVPYAYAFPQNITTPDGKEVAFGLQGPSMPGLLNYSSTKDDVVRSCCKTCGARVFYWSAKRPQVIPIAVGILRAPEGAAAGNWLWWRDAVLWAGQEIDHELVEALQNKEALERTQ